MTAETVLIVEDDATLLRVLRDNFEYNARHAQCRSNRHKREQANMLALSTDVTLRRRARAMRNAT